MNPVAEIEAKVRELANSLGHNPRGLTVDTVLPQSGLLDSASILELILWLELHFDVEIDQDDLSMDNFGTIRKIVNYIAAVKR